jgi:hypothetical protein
LRIICLLQVKSQGEAGVQFGVKFGDAQTSIMVQFLLHGLNQQSDH